MKNTALLLALALSTPLAIAKDIPLQNTEAFSKEADWNKGAATALENFLNAVNDAGFSGTSEEVWELISDSNKVGEDKEKFLKSKFPPMSEKVLKAYSKHVEFELTDFQMNTPTQLSFTVQQTRPRPSMELFMELLSNWTPETDTKLAQYFKSSPELELDTRASDYIMKLEQGKWKYYNPMHDKEWLEQQKTIGQQHEKADRLIKEAGIESASLEMIGPDLYGSKLQWIETEAEFLKNYDVIVEAASLYPQKYNPYKKTADDLKAYLADLKAIQPKIVVRDVKITKREEGRYSVSGTVKNNSKIPVSFITVGTQKKGYYDYGFAQLENYSDTLKPGQSGQFKKDLPYSNTPYEKNPTFVVTDFTIED